MKRIHLINPKPNLEETMDPIIVVFRQWKFKRWKHGEGRDIIALFPEIPSVCTNPYYISSYEHIGQHGAVSPRIMDSTKPVDINEPDVQELIKELYRVGYNHLVVYSKLDSRKFYAIRRNNLQKISKSA